MSTTPVIPGSQPQETQRRRSPREYFNAFRRVVLRAFPSEDPNAMTILEHLETLRVRTLKAILAVLAMTLLSFAYSRQLVNYLASPVGGSEGLVSIEVTENLSVFMRVSLLAGFILGFPFVVYQIVAFILPGLNQRERRWLYFLIPSASVLFLAGVAFAWFVMVPTALPFLLNFLGIQTAPRPLNYFSFVTSFLFWVGLSFEMPLVILFLAKLKFVTAGQLIRGWRYAAMGIAVLAAVVTPTVDPVNMLIVSVPLVVLYLIGVGLARLA